VTLLSAPPTSVTAVNGPNVPQTPFRSGAVARSTKSPAGSTPAPKSVPREIVNGTALVEKNGPPLTVIVCPVGAVGSALIVIAAVDV
jgi:hypothetical protein